MDNKQISSMATSRNYSFDILKIVSMFVVVLAHSSSKAVENATVFANPDFFFANVFDACARFSVPAFVMISGVLMLNEHKQLSTELVFSKYIKKIVYVLLFWSAFYTAIFACFLPISKGWTVHPDKVILYFVQGHYHLWYLFMIIGLYISTPVLRQFVKKDNEKIVLYFLKVSFIFQGILPFIIQLIKTFGGKNLAETLDLFSLDTFLGFSFYYILGWYLSNFEIKRKTENTIYILGILSILFSIFFTYFASVKLNKPYLITYRNYCFTNNIYAAAVFLLFKRLFAGKTFSYKSQRIITSLSALTFGVYLIHPFFIELFRSTFNEIKPQTAGILLLWLCSLVMSFASCWLLSKIPGLKKIIKT